MTRRKTTTRARGFTLIELMIVVAIIGVLAALAIPSYNRFTCTTRATEARLGLQSILRHQAAYRSEYDKYIVGADAETTILDELMKGGPNSGLYVYDIVAGPDDGFVATAVGQRSQAGDKWTISDKNDLLHVAPAEACK